MEWYQAGSDYLGLMEECEALIPFVAAAVGLEQEFSFHGKRIDLAGVWERISVREAFRRFSQISMREALERDLFDEIMVVDIEPRLGIGKPTLIYDYPAEQSTLARLKKDDPTVAERFELYIGGIELANGFSELINPEEQRSRFLLEQENRRSVGKSVYPMPERFLAELEHMPPSAGIALGVDRLIMVLLDVATIDEVVAFTPEEL